MFVKIIGALFIAVSSLTLSNYFCSRYTREKDELEGFISLLRRIRLEISCFSKPLPDIFAEFSCPSLDRTGFTEALREKGFTEAVVRTRHALSLSDEATDILLSFSGELGHGYCEDEIKRCDRAVQCIEEEYRKCLDALPGKSKLIRSLSLTFGISVIILFI